MTQDGPPRAEPDGVAPPSRSAWRVDVGPLRRSPQFRLLYLGQGVSFAGSMLTYVALPYQTYRLTHSSLLVGLLSLCELIPILAVGLVGGAIADAMDRRRMVVVADIGLLGCSALLVANAALPHPRLWPLFVITAFMATLGSLQGPSLDALLPRLVSRSDIPAATALSSLRDNFGQVIGPAVAGGLLAAGGLGIVYGLDVATFAVSLFALWRMNPVPAPPDAQRVSVAAIAQGLRYARSRQDLLGTYAVDMAAMFFGMPEALFPQLASRLGGPGILGLLLAAPALGSLVVSATSGWARRLRHQGRAVVVAAGAWGVAMVGLGVAPNTELALGALVVAGGLDMVSALMRSTIWNSRCPTNYGVAWPGSS